MISFDTVITYSQIAVFNSNLDEPFNDWNDDQVRQGFSWRPESVSFKTLANDIVAHVTFEKVSRFVPSAESERTISVPFICNAVGEIEIAGITDSQPISLRPGEYQLVFETGMDGEHNWCRISAVEDGDLEPSVLKADSEIAPSYPLVMTAQSA